MKNMPQATKPAFSESELAEFASKGRQILALLKSKGLYKPLKTYPARLEEGRITYGEGRPITAFEKFLGYYDKIANIANSPSISIVTDFSVARCFCKYVSAAGMDRVVLDGESDERYTKRSVKALDKFREITGVEGSFQFSIVRVKKYSKAKGLGESAAVAEATSRALVGNVFGDAAAKDNEYVSRFARLVSGSGTRAATGGMSIWASFPGIGEAECYAARLPVDTSKLHFAVFPDFHNIQTMDAHGIASSSEFYATWIKNKYDRVLKIIGAGFDLEDLMRYAQADTFRLRALLMSGGVAIDTEKSLSLINAVSSFQQGGGRVWLTADTGPSIVVMSDDKDELDAFVSGQRSRPIYGHVPELTGLSPDAAAMAKATDFFNSIR